MNIHQSINELSTTMTTEGPLPVNMNLPNCVFPENKINVPIVSPSIEDSYKTFYSNQNMVDFGQRENFVNVQDGPPFECNTASGTTATNNIVNSEQSGNLMRGYSFLADQIYRSVSNPLYKLIRTVEDTVGDGNPTNSIEEQLSIGDESFLHYQKFYDGSIKPSGGIALPKVRKPNLNVSTCVKFESGEINGCQFDSEGKLEASHNEGASPQIVQNPTISQFGVQASVTANTVFSSPSSTSSKSSFSFQGEAAHNQPVRGVRRPGFNIWEPQPGQQWYPQQLQQHPHQRQQQEDNSRPPTETYTWPNQAKTMQNPFASLNLNNAPQTSEHSSPAESPKTQVPSIAPPITVAATFETEHRYHQQYFQEWVDANQYYPQFENNPQCASPRNSEEQQNFPANTPNTSGNAMASCNGCCTIPIQNPSSVQQTTYPQPISQPAPIQSNDESDLQNKICLVDPMRSLPRYLTSGLWPSCINPKLEWNGYAPGSIDENSRLPNMNRFYTGETSSTPPAHVGGDSYQSRMSAMQYMSTSYGFSTTQDTKDCISGCFFPNVPRVMYGGPDIMSAGFRHKVDKHRISAVDCDPQELESFAERFKQRRIKLGVTQADVGKALGRLNLAGAGSFSQSTICRFESLTLSHNNMLALKPILQAWLDEAEQEAAARQKNPNAFDLEDEDKKRKRTSITDPEKRSLEAFFGIQPRPSSEKIAQIAEKLNLKKNVVRVWFCNQRQKQKRMKFSTVGLLHQINGM